MGEDHGTTGHFFEFYWKLTWTLERRWAKQCWFRDVSSGERKPQRGSDWAHIWAKKNHREERKNKQRFRKTCKKALSRDETAERWCLWWYGQIGMGTFTWYSENEWSQWFQGRFTAIKALLQDTKLSRNLLWNLHSPLEVCVEKLCSELSLSPAWRLSPAEW